MVSSHAAARTCLRTACISAVLFIWCGPGRCMATFLSSPLLYQTPAPALAPAVPLSHALPSVYAIEVEASCSSPSLSPWYLAMTLV